MTNEHDLIKAVLGGDVEVYAELVKAHQARIRLVCLSLLHNPSEADDAAQEAFLKAYQSLASFKGKASFGTWLAHIAANHCLDILRSTQRQRTDSLDALFEQRGEQLTNLLTGPAERTHTPEELELLGQVLAALADEDREILLLRELEEMSYDEIASKLQCSLDAVKGRLKRARKRLIDKCRHLYDTSPAAQRPY